MSVLSRRASSSSDTSTSSDTISYESKPTRRNPNKTSTFPKKPFKERSYAEMLCSLALADPKVHGKALSILCPVSCPDDFIPESFWQRCAETDVVPSRLQSWSR